MGARVVRLGRALHLSGGEADGPLPTLLLMMTVVTGLVDAFSYLVLGHVFVANMTGNVVFLGFALAGAPGFSLSGSLTALGCFWLGALTGGAAGARLGRHRGRLLASTSEFEAALFGASLVVTLSVASPVQGAARSALIAMLAIAMGAQNATARRLAVADLTTTVLTLTITGTAADSAFIGGKGAAPGRRVLSVVAMFSGALVGAVLVVHGHTVLTLAAALVLLVAVAVVVGLLGRHGASWAHPPVVHP